jgi:iron complex outermembrane receptor protein
MIHKAIKRTLAAAVGVGVITSVAAQDKAATRDDAGLEEVVVTAQRRVESLQDVAIAATAIPGEQLRAKAVDRLDDLQFAAPSLIITDSGLVQSVNIRGIGLASGSPQVTNGVATYIDGLFQPPIVTTNSFYDIANVEVLRGPQGTLAGANSTGGAIFITTNNPQLGAPDAYAEAEFGSYGTQAAQGAVNVPMGDTFAMRLAGNYRKRDSYYDDIGPFDNEADGLDEVSGRLGALWKPGAYQALAKVEIADKSTGGYAYRPMATTTFAPFAAPGGIRKLDYNTPTDTDEHAAMFGLEQRYEMANGVVFRFLSGYQDKKVHNLFDTDATEADDQTFDQRVRERQHSEEINIISPTDGAFSWILGGYYQQNKIDVDILILGGPVPVNVEPRNEKTTTGIFAQTNFTLTPRVELQVGARYSRFEATGIGGVFIGRGLPFFPPGGLQVADTNGDHSDGSTTGKVNVNFKLNDDHLLYAFVARGAKPGGFNSSTSEFEPEAVWDYEAGWKATLADGHVRTQLGVFYNRYSDFQFDIRDLTTGQDGTSNLPDATIKGAEAQLQMAYGGFKFDAGVAYVDSKLSSLTFVNTRQLPVGIGPLGPQCASGVSSNPPTCFDYTPFMQTTQDGPNLFSPKWTYNAGVEYAIPVGQHTLTPRVNYAYVGPVYTELFYSPVTDRLEGRGLLSALLTFEAQAWSVQAYGTNLTDKEYVTGQTNEGNQFFGAPREYGLRIRREF